MIRCSCHGDHGCVPVAPSAIPERIDDGLQLRPALGHRGGDVGERLAAPGLHLDLRRDQLPDDVRLERRPLRSRLNLLEAVDEVQRRGIEEGELLLHRDGEVRAGFEALAGRGEELLVAERLLVTHARRVDDRRTVPASGARRPPSSSA